MKTYHVIYGDCSWEIEAESEDDAREEIAAGLAQSDDRFAHPRDEAAMLDIVAYEVSE